MKVIEELEEHDSEEGEQPVKKRVKVATMRDKVSRCILSRGMS